MARRFVGNGDDAYDIVQESFVSAWLSLSRFNAELDFGPWISTILLNKCRDFSRRRAVRRRLSQWLGFGVDDVTAAHAAAPGNGLHAAEEDRLSALDSAIAQPPRQYKEPLILTALQGLCHRAAAEQPGLTPEVVELRVSRARRKLHEQLRAGQS